MRDKDLFTELMALTIFNLTAIIYIHSFTKKLGMQIFNFALV